MEYYKITERELWLLRGATVHIAWQVLDEDEEAANIFNHTAMFEIVRSPTAPEQLYKCTTDDYLFVHGASGTIEMVIPADDTAEWAFNSAWFRLWIYDQHNTVSRLAQGNIRIG